MPGSSLETTTKDSLPKPRSALPTGLDSTFPCLQKPKVRRRMSAELSSICSTTARDKALGMNGSQAAPRGDHLQTTRLKRAASNRELLDAADTAAATEETIAA